MGGFIAIGAAYVMILFTPGKTRAGQSLKLEELREREESATSPEVLILSKAKGKGYPHRMAPPAIAYLELARASYRRTSLASTHTTPSFSPNMRPVSRLLSPAIDTGFSHYAGEQSRHVASKFFKNFASFGVSMPFGSSPAIFVVNQVWWERYNHPAPSLPLDMIDDLSRAMGPLRSSINREIDPR